MDEVARIRKELEKVMPSNNTEKALDLLKSLASIPITLDILQKTHIGMTVNKIRKSAKDPELSNLSKSMVKKWKKLLSTSTSSSSLSTTGSSANTGATIAGAVSVSSGDSGITKSNNTTSTTSNNNSNNNNNNGNNSIPNSNSLSSHNNTGSNSSPPNTSFRDPEANLKSSTASGDHIDSRSTTNATTGSAVKSERATVNRPVPVQQEVPSTKSAVRLKTREMLSNALKKPLPSNLANESFLDAENLAGMIEECMYQEFKGTDTKYLNRMRSRVANLGDSKNPYLRLNVLRGDISAERIAKMTADEMASDDLKKQREQFTKEAINDHQMTHTSGTKTSEIKCPACKKYNVTYNQVQTRSADEPMTTFCYCNECGKRWKFC